MPVYRTPHLATEEGWDYPEDYLPTTLIATVVTFVLFRIASGWQKAFFINQTDRW